MSSMSDAVASGDGRRLVLLRHGQTSWNAQRRAQGHTNTGLDETGRAQATLAAPWVVAMGLAGVVSSDLARAADTARIVAEAGDLPLTFDERLREFDLGQRTGLTMSEYAALAPEEYRLFRSGQYDVVLGGEKTAAVVARMRAGIHAALEATGPGETVLVVSHGACLKVTLLALLELPSEAAAHLRALVNCAWAILEETTAGGSLRLVSYNLQAPGATAVNGPAF